MTFIEAIEEMKKGKLVSSVAVPALKYHIVAGIIKEYETGECIGIEGIELRADWVVVGETSTDLSLP